MNNNCYGVIYKITNKVNGHFYIGETTKKGIEFEKYLGSGLKIIKAIQKYGKDNFEKIILWESFNKQQLDIYEKFFIKLLNPYYNIASGGQGGNLGPEVNEKIKIKALGNKVNLGRKQTKEHVNNRSKAMKGKLKGKGLSEEHKKKISNALKGKRVSKETCIKLSSSLKGKPFSEEHKTNLKKSWEIRRLHYGISKSI